jgi:hypothetical protein
VDGATKLQSLLPEVASGAGVLRVSAEASLPTSEVATAIMEPLIGVEAWSPTLEADTAEVKFLISADATNLSDNCNWLVLVVSDSELSSRVPVYGGACL